MIQFPPSKIVFLSLSVSYSQWNLLKITCAQLVPEMLATDIAEYLVRKGVPFRETHCSWRSCQDYEDRGVPLNTLTVADLKVSLIHTDKRIYFNFVS